jgi:hypothetical protein
MLDVSKLSEREALGVLLFICYDWGSPCYSSYSTIFHQLVSVVSAQLKGMLAEFSRHEFYCASRRLHFHILLANNTPKSLGITDKEYQFLKGLPVE